MPKAYESGYVGTLYSLAGLRSRPGTGRVVEQNYIDAAPVFARDAVPSNPARVWLEMCNSGAADVFVCFGNVTPGGAASLNLHPGDILIINQNMPWTGSIGFSSTAQIEIQYQECSLAAT